MAIERARRFRRAARIANARYFSVIYRGLSTAGAADLLLLPLTLLMLALFLFGSVPGASDIIAAACETACMP